MRHGIFLAGAALLALSGAAIAQDAPANPSTEPATQTPPAADTATPPDASTTGMAPTPSTGTTAPTTATEGAATTGTTTGATTDTGAAAAAQGAAASTASASVQADWAKYDKDSDGTLTPLEFGEWILASRGQDITAQAEKSRQSKAANLPAVKVLNATAGEFAKADGDKDRKVSPAELTTYLSA